MSFLASSNLRYVPLIGVIEYSHTISEVEILDKEIIEVNKGFFCGYKYKFKSIKNYRGVTKEGVFWNTRKIPINDKVVVFI